MNAGIKVSGIPSGGIIAWQGAIIDIPYGFVLCDGNNGTSNLMDQSIVGAGNSYAVDASGGATTHGHTASQGIHYHSLPMGTDIAAGTDYDAETDEKQPTVAVQPGSSLSPYYAKCFIMKT